MYLEFNAIGLKFCAEVKATRFVPASVCGLPENSFPEEGGEIEEWESLQVNCSETYKNHPEQNKEVFKDASFLLWSNVFDQIEQAAYEAIADYQPAYDDFGDF